MKSCLTIKFFFSVALIVGLSSCDKSPIEQIKAVTGDKYPVANMPDEPLDKPLEIVREPKRLAMTSTWSAGVKDDGTLWTWGTGSLLRKTETGQDPTPRPVDDIHDAVAVSGGGGHMLLLRKDGTVWGWGSNHDGEIDPSDKDTSIDELRQIKGIDNVVDIVAGADDSFFITKDGFVYTIGLNEKGWTNGANEKNKIPTKIPNLTNIIRVESRGNVLLALNQKGELFSTGTDWRSLGREILVKTDGIEFYPANQVFLPKKVVDFFADGSNLGALLEDGQVWIWGANNRAGLAVSNKSRIPLPIKNQYLHQIVNIGIGSAVSKNNELYIWGQQGFGESKNSVSIKNYYQPILIKQNIDSLEFVFGYQTSGLLSKDGSAWYWDRNDLGQRGTGEIIKTLYEDYILTPQKSLFNIHK